MDKSELLLERLAVKIRPHFVGIALCSLVLLIGAVCFRVYSFNSSCESAAGLALVFQSLALCLAAVPLLCRAVLPSVDKHSSEVRLLERLKCSTPENWILLQEEAHDINLPYPSFYYFADHDLILVAASDYKPFRQPWLDEKLGSTLTWDENSVTLVTYHLRHHNFTKAKLDILCVDGTRVIIPMPTTKSVHTDQIKYRVQDYKLAKIIDHYWNDNANLFDTDNALQLYGIRSEDTVTD